MAISNNSVGDVDRFPVRSPVREAVPLPFSFTTAADGTVSTASFPRGISSIARTAEGVYTITHVKAPARLACVAQTSLGVEVAIGGDVTAGITTITTDSAAADIDSATCHGVLWLRGSIVE